GARCCATVVAFDRRNDIAVWRVDGLDSRPLPLADARPGAAVAVLGFPENGPFAATPARIGKTAVVLAEDAYGTGPVARPITSLRGRVRHGDSGAPGVDGRGAVEATIFAARLRSAGGDRGPPNAGHARLRSAGGAPSAAGLA